MNKVLSFKIDQIREYFDIIETAKLAPKITYNITCSNKKLYKYLIRKNIKEPSNFHLILKELESEEK